MPKFSIIVPVYNVEKYIKKCLDSIKSQTYKDYEIIVVNDGTKDNSMDIVNKYNVTVINQKNQGLSAARNTGVKHANGEYILFLDSDDYIEKDLLSRLSRSIENHPDIVRFQIRKVFEDKNITKDYKEKPFINRTGEDAFNLISKYHYVENAWAYVFRLSFYKENKFSFKKGMVHEDFGLIPLIIMKAKRVNSISYIGYNYVQRSGSIMNEKNYEKTKKKVDDFYNHYLYLNSEIEKTNLNKVIFKSFIANSLIIKICELKGNDYKEYKKKLKDLKVYDSMISDTMSRKVKKVLFKISPKLGVKLIK